MNHRAASTRLTPPATPPEPVEAWPAGLMAGAALLIALVALVASASGRSISPLTWYLTRAAGVSLYLTFWLTTVLGLGLTTTLLDRFGGRAVLYSVHRFATQLAYGFLAIHLLTLVIDQTVPFGPAALLIPFAASWREPWTGLGVIAAELMLLIGVSLGLRRWIGQRGWRALHFFAFPAYAMSLAHAIGAGSDAGALWLQLVYASTGLIVLWLALYRLLRGAARARPDWSARPAPPDRLAVAPTRRAS